MYYINEFEVEGFWHRGTAKCKIFKDLSVIVGKNGTGKTTFINILISILTFDLKGISELDFSKATIKLSNGSSQKTISVLKDYDNPFFIQSIIYKIGNKQFEFNLGQTKKHSFRDSPFESSSHKFGALRKELDSLIRVQSLSVYRLRNIDNYADIQKSSREVLSPIDYKLNEVMNSLVVYQLELSQKANSISDNLKKELLFSILHNFNSVPKQGEVRFSRADEKAKLTKAFKQINAYDEKVEAKIEKHLNLIEENLKLFKEIKEAPFNKKNFDTKIEQLPNLIASLQTLNKTNSFINMSLEAEEKRKNIFKPLDNFLEILSSFIEDKKFTITQEGISVKNKYNEEVSILSLSSGEKQVIILLTEALLQRNQKNIYITDEPELSLHITWQRMVIPSLMKLNENAQIIVATHSPEIASYDKSKIISMREIFNG